MWGVRGGREYPPLTHIQSKARRFLFLLSAYLLVAEAASFDKKELCRSDTVSKNAEFHADFESVEKMYQKKVISKNVTEKCTFFTFTHACQFVLFLTFVCEIFKQI